MTATHALLVALGAAVGAPARMLVAEWVRDRFGAPTPAGTLVVNVLGSFVLGMFVGAGVEGGWLALVGTGFCGAFTTFSSLALEVWDALLERRRTEAVGIVALSLALGIGAAVLGYLLAA